MKKKHNYPIILITNGIIMTTLLTLSFYTKRIKKIYYDPHIWIPWKNKTPWKNNVYKWWHNKNPWVNKFPWKNNKPWFNKNPWQNKIIK